MRQTALHLLERSSETREFLLQLQLNAHRLKNLPRHKVEPSLVDGIMQAINESKAQPKPAAAPDGAAGCRMSPRPWPLRS